MEALSVRQPDSAQWPEVSRAIDTAFFVLVPDGEQTRDHLRPLERRFALMAGERVVGGCFSYAFGMSLPGGTLVPTAGLAGVGILPTAQGKGGFSALVDAHLQNSIEQGDALSALLASESGLYGRFGYGVATEYSEYRLETRAFALKGEVPTGSVELVDDEKRARQICAQIHNAQIIPGKLQRSCDWWAQVIHSNKRTWLGGGPQFIAVHYDDQGHADGYALYVVDTTDSENQVSDGNLRAKLTLHELVTLNLNAEGALFAYLCRIAWVRELRWILAPIDPLIKHRMTDPRQLAQVNRCDMTWLRVLDMPKVLSTRAYDFDGDISFHYEDEKFPQFSGCFSLKARSGLPGRSLVERIEASSAPMLSFGPQQLAAFLLGGTRVACLYQLGEITGPHETMNLLDRLFSTGRAPFNISKF